jgi:hypothetical protein
MAEAYAPPRPPHPVQFEVEYPDRLSRGLIFVKWLLAFPQYIVVYLLLLVAELLAVLAWFGILFTGRYPKSFFEFGAGALRWQSQLSAYIFLLRDEYPPFSWEPGSYPLLLEIPPADRQSRWRLFIRFIAIIPNQVALLVVSIGALFTTFIAWWAILFTGRYPRGLFRFAVGVLRWQQRVFAYVFLLRDEYPPYSVRAEARPGNEALSALIGAPLFAAYIAFLFLPFFGMFAGGTTRVRVDQQALTTRGALAREDVSAESGSIRIMLLDYDDLAFSADSEVDPGYRLVAFRIAAEKSGWVPALWTPYFFSVRDCAGQAYSVDGSATSAKGVVFGILWRSGKLEKDVYFQLPSGADPCELRYFAGRGSIRFLFR